MNVDDVLLDSEERMEKAIEILKKNLGGIRTGRANPGLIDSLRVDVYGSPTPIKQIASVGAPVAGGAACVTGAVGGAAAPGGGGLGGLRGAAGVPGRGNGCGVCADRLDIASTATTPTHRPRKHGSTELL